MITKYLFIWSDQSAGCCLAGWLDGWMVGWLVGYQMVNNKNAVKNVIKSLDFYIAVYVQSAAG